MENTMATQALIRHRIGIGFRYLLLITLTLVIILPFVLGLWTSFLPTTTIAKGSLSGTLSWQNYQDAFTKTPILRYLFNT